MKLSEIPAALKARLDADAWVIANSIPVILGPDSSSTPADVLGDKLEALKDNAMALVVEQPGSARLDDSMGGRALLMAQVSIVLGEASNINRVAGGPNISPLVAIEEVISAAIDPDDVHVSPGEAWAAMGKDGGNLYWRLNFEVRVALSPRA